MDSVFFISCRCGADECRKLHRENDLLKTEVESLKPKLAANRTDSSDQECFQKQLNEYNKR